MTLRPFNSSKRPSDFLALNLRTHRDEARQRWLDENGFEMIHWGHPRWEQWEYMLSSCRFCGTSIHTPCTKDVEQDLAAAIIHLDWHAAADDHWNAHYKHTHKVTDADGNATFDKNLVAGEPIQPEKDTDYKPPGVYC